MIKVKMMKIKMIKVKMIKMIKVNMMMVKMTSIHLALHPDLSGVPGHPDFPRDSGSTESDKDFDEGKVLFLLMNL